MYTIGQVSEMFGIPISTFRYYDREGLVSETEGTGGSGEVRKEPGPGQDQN